MLWITENLGTLLICLALAAIVTGIVLTLVKNRRKGKGPCGCGCQSCALSEVCRQKK